MSMEFKYIESTSVNPYRNLAEEEILMNYVSPGVIIVYLWQNEKTIVVGRNQDIYKECKAHEFLKVGGKIARRKSGGGAVYHDLGNLNFSLISYREDFFSYQQLIFAAMKCYSIVPVFNGRNDLLIQNRKFSGNAAHYRNGIVCQHGTVLINCNLNEMAYYLTPEKSKLSRNHIHSIEARTINLKEIINYLNVETFKKSIIEAIDAKQLMCNIDRTEVDALELFYGSESWIISGREPKGVCSR